MVEKFRSLSKQQRNVGMKMTEAELWLSEKQAEVEMMGVPRTAHKAAQQTNDVVNLLDDVNGIAFLFDIIVRFYNQPPSNQPKLFILVIGIKYH